MFNSKVASEIQSQPSAGIRKLSLFKILVTFSLLATAALCGTWSYLVLVHAQERRYHQAYKASTNELGELAKHVLLMNKESGAAMSRVFETVHPQSTSWPNASIDSTLHESILTHMSLMTHARLFTMAIVYPPEIHSFEAHMRGVFTNDDNIPESAGNFSFGFGVASINAGGNLYHDTTGEHLHSDRQFVAPVINCDGSDHCHKDLMVNMNSRPVVKDAITSVLDCIDEVGVDIGRDHCIVISDLVAEQHPQGPNSLIVVPISALNATGHRVLVGLQGVAFNWKESLQAVLFTHIDGMAAVLSSGETTVTFHIMHKKVKKVQLGDHHDRRFSDMRRDVNIGDLEMHMKEESDDAWGDGLMDDSVMGDHMHSDANTVLSARRSLRGNHQDIAATGEKRRHSGIIGIENYRMDLYPEQHMYYEYMKSKMPVYTAIASVSIVLITAVIFFIYVYFVDQESNAHDHILAARRDFVRLVSHEIRTPLNTVTMGLKLLEEQIRSSVISATDIPLDIQKQIDDHSEESLDLMKDIQGNTTIAISVLNDLLQYDKIQMGQLQLEKEVFKIAKCVQQIAQSFSIQARQVKVEIATVLHETGSLDVTVADLFVFADRVRVSQVMRNLISNALKFNPPESKVTISIEYHSKSSLSVPLDVTEVAGVEGTIRSSGAVRIAVVDEGPGISVENQRKLFQQGTQFNPNKLQGGNGTGLGLWIAKNIIEMHEGKIWVHSEGDGMGSSFFVELPVITGAKLADLSERAAPQAPIHLPLSFKSTQSEVQQTASPTEVDDELNQTAINEQPYVVDSSDVSSQPLRILVVDDATSNRKFLCRLLRLRGYECDEAADGVKAVDMMSKAKSDTYCCILMDFIMPNMNGPEATREIRQMGFTKLPIIGVTGNVMADDVEYFMSCGATEVLPKPLDVHQFERILALSVADECGSSNT